MKKFLVITSGLVIAFLAMVIAYDWMNLQLVRQSSGNVAYKMERLFGKLAEDEVPVLGSSRAQANFVPSVLGPWYFNYGIDGSGTRETLFLLRVLLRKKQRGLVVVNLDPWGFSNFGDAPTANFHGSYRLAALSAEVRRALPEGLVARLDWVPGVRFQGQLRNNLTQMINARRAMTKVVDRGAVLLKNARTDAEWKVIDAKIRPMGFGLPSQDCAEVLDCVRSMLKAKGGVLKVVFVIGPCSPSWKQMFRGGDDLKKWADAFRSSETPVLDMFTDSNYGSDLFVDPTHLNVKGATRFSKDLKDRLEQMGL